LTIILFLQLMEHYFYTIQHSSSIRTWPETGMHWRQKQLTIHILQAELFQISTEINEMDDPLFLIQFINTFRWCHTI
jgi:hypothetical protein